MTQTLAEKAYQRIKKLIVSNSYSAGVPLREQELIKKLRMSRTPIREALRKLEHENLVEIIPQKGAFVTNISPQRLRELFQVREIIEPRVTELATPTISIAKLSDIERQVLHLRSKKEIDCSEAQRMDEKLHDLILTTVGNKILVRIVRALMTDITRACHFAMTKPENVQKLLEQHLEIIAALKARNSEKARQKMVEHFLCARSWIFE